MVEYKNIISQMDIYPELNINKNKNAIMNIAIKFNKFIPTKRSNLIPISHKIKSQK